MQPWRGMFEHWARNRLRVFSFWMGDRVNEGLIHPRLPLTPSLSHSHHTPFTLHPCRLLTLTPVSELKRIAAMWQGDQTCRVTQNACGSGKGRSVLQRPLCMISSRRTGIEFVSFLCAPGVVKVCVSAWMCAYVWWGCNVAFVLLHSAPSMSQLMEVCIHAGWGW